MSDIKEDFKQWLIKQGIKEKNVNGRLSTVSEYIRYINHICDILYGQHTSNEWNKLRDIIIQLLILYHETKNEEYFIDLYNINQAITHFKNINNYNKQKLNLSSIEPSMSVSIILNQHEYDLDRISFNELPSILSTIKEIFTFIDTNQWTDLNKIPVLLKIRGVDDKSLKIGKNFSDLFNNNSLTKNCPISFHFRYFANKNNKYYTALKLLYDFLCGNNILKSVINFSQLKSSYDNVMRCTTVFDKTGMSPLIIKSHYPDGKLSPSEVSSVLEIDYNTLVSLKKKNILLPNYPACAGYYLESDINPYLKQHFHRANVSYSGIDYSLVEKNKGEVWCNRKKASEILCCTEKTVYSYTKKGFLTYTDYSPQAPRYYIPELSHVKSLRNFPKNYHKSKLKP